jgi:hypothetical protein
MLSPGAEGGEGACGWGEGSDEWECDAAHRNRIKIMGLLLAVATKVDRNMLQIECGFLLIFR